MKGHVQTPSEIANRMVSLLFDGKPPQDNSRILYPGCGAEGPFITAVRAYCSDRELPVPNGVAFETHPERFNSVQAAHELEPVEFRNEDFLQELPNLSTFDYIIGNPPYVPIEKIEQKDAYRARFEAAQDRFDLYMLFYEQSLHLLADSGRLCLITPEKYEYTQTAKPLREFVATHHVERIEHLQEDAFDGYVTYPTISLVTNTEPGPTEISRRDGSTETVTLPTDGESWAPHIRKSRGDILDTGVTLGDVTERISCGIATGRDGIFVKPAAADGGDESVPPQLVAEGWTYPTISGKQLRLHDGPEPEDVLICPYDERGNLIPEDRLGVFGDWAELHREELEARSCVDKGGKPWYSWHERPPMDDIIGRPKLLCSDVAQTPQFWVDETGEILPRHSVYYIIPKEMVTIAKLQSYLNGPQARAWLETHCQRAANGYYRLQSTVLKDLPVPTEFGETKQVTLS